MSRSSSPPPPPPQPPPQLIPRAVVGLATRSGFVRAHLATDAECDAVVSIFEKVIIPDLFMGWDAAIVVDRAAMTVCLRVREHSAFDREVCRERRRTKLRRAATILRATWKRGRIVKALREHGRRRRPTVKPKPLSGWVWSPQQSIRDNLRVYLFYATTTVRAQARARRHATRTALWRVWLQPQQRWARRLVHRLAPDAYAPALRAERLRRQGERRWQRMSATEKAALHVVAGAAVLGFLFLRATDA